MIPQPPEPVEILLQDALERLAGGIRIQTISNRDPNLIHPDEFFTFHRYLEKQYPKAHTVLKKETVNKYSLLYTWEGRQPNLKPLVLLSHLDVVPIAPETRNDWKYPPFEGAIADGYIWGRGTLDVKSALFGIMESIEMLAAQDRQPERTIHLIFGHDEEVGGTNGNAKISALFKQRNIRPFILFDEGLPIVSGMVPGITKPLASIGILEKGYVSLTLSVKAKGGHSSIPPKHTAIGILSQAVQRLENNQFPASFDGPVENMFDYIAPEMSTTMKMLFANLWLFRPVIQKKLEAAPPSNAILRTTTAVTMIQGGIKENILPKTAKATVNFRIRAGETVESVVEHVKKTIANPLIDVRKTGFIEKNPTPVNDPAGKGFQMIQKTVHQIFPDVVVAPGIMVGGTDSQYYAGLADNIFLFFPWRLDKKELAGIHGVNERLSVKNFKEAIRFYYQLIKNAAYDAASCLPSTVVPSTVVGPNEHKVYNG